MSPRPSHPNFEPQRCWARLIFACAAGAAGISPALVVACATEEIPTYGDPANLVAGSGSPSDTVTSSQTTAETSAAQTTSTGGACDVESDCAVSFADNVIPILTAEGCAKAGCHAPDGATPPKLDLASPTAARTAILEYEMKSGAPYVVPCDTEGSAMLCNLALPDGEEHPYRPGGAACGTPMPIGDTLTSEDLSTIAAWIACGAPDN